MATDSRVRKRYEVVPKFSTYGAVPNPPSYVGTVFQSERARLWSRGFKNRKAVAQSLIVNGFLPTLGYQDDLQEIVHSKVVRLSGLLYSAPNSSFEYHFIPVMNRVGVNPDTDPLVASLAAQVQESLQSKISGNGFNAAVTAVEAEKTLGMVGRAARDLAAAYSDVRHGRFSSAAKRLGLARPPKGTRRGRSFESNWLEYRYGWRLVVQDVYSLMTTLHDSLVNRPPILRVSASRGANQSTSGSSGTKSVWLPNGMQACWYDESYEATFTYDVRGGYVYQLESVALSNGQSFGLINPATFAWEVIPYSFVIDWFVNVGSVLEGLTAFQGKKQLDGWLCKMVQSSITRKWENIRRASVYALTQSGSLFFEPQLERRFRRSFMAFTPSSIRVDVDLTIPRILDAIGLLAQRR